MLPFNDRRSPAGRSQLALASAKVLKPITIGFGFGCARPHLVHAYLSASCIISYQRHLLSQQGTYHFRT